MENMNLASRCRQAIAEAADLKRKVAGYEKRHKDFGNLQREVLLLRRQIERQHGGGGGGSNSGSGNNSGNSSNVGSSRRRNRSSSPKGGAKRNNGSNDGGGSVTPVNEKKKMAVLAAAAAATTSTTTLETKGSGETTDLDRIMAQELFKRGGTTGGGGGADNDDEDEAAAVGVNNGGGMEDGSSSDNVMEKKDGNASAVTKKFKELQISTATANSTVHGNIISKVGGSKASSSSSTTLASTSNATTSSKRSAVQTSSSSTTDHNNTSSSSATNAKIPISVISSSATQKDEDEFDAEMGMVDFFAKPSKPTTIDTTTSISSSSSTANDNNSNNSNEADIPPAPTTHSRKNIPRKMKKTETDDHMPEELVGSVGCELLSPSAGSKKNVGDNLLSSLDAFEASFASAFPETSFSLKCEAPLSTQLFDVDVPVFDPFFKSPVNKDVGGSTSTSLQTSPKSKSSSSSSTSGAVGGGSNHQKDGTKKSQLKDLFPDSALTTSPKRGLDLTFDSTFPDVDMNISSSNSKSGKGKSLSTDKLDSTFSRGHSTTPTKTSGGSNNKATSNRATPLDMSAEIQQLDALASAAPEKAEGVERKRSVRKVKTPLSYAEPSTKQKLRRGDVLFPKIDADRKLELEAKQRSKNGGISPTTDLDRIMSEHFSVNSKSGKKDGTVPS